MSKQAQTQTQEVDAKLREAVEAREKAESARDAAHSAYRDAAAAGDMAAALERQNEVSTAERELKVWRDRIKALEAQRAEAVKADAEPAYQAALKKAREAAAAEVEKVNEAIVVAEQMTRLEAELKEVTKAAHAAARAMHHAAVAAGHEPPRLERKRISEANPSRMIGAARAIGFIGDDQSQKMMTTESERRAMRVA